MKCSLCQEHKGNASKLMELNNKDRKKKEMYAKRQETPGKMKT